MYIPYFYKNESDIYYHSDYTRIATLYLLAEEIKKRKIGGVLAELGVYKGWFAKCMNICFPDRKLYLFDTFEGFAGTDVDVELQNRYTSDEFAFNGRFSETSIEAVLGIMQYPDNCIVRKGTFPNTIPNEEIQYSLVSLDCDLYQPMLAGIKYFYPRLTKGGYIIIHDYNNNGRWFGIKEALKESEEEIGHICKVPLSDRAGSLVLTK